MYNFDSSSRGLWPTIANQWLLRYSIFNLIVQLRTPTQCDLPTETRRLELQSAKTGAQSQIQADLAVLDGQHARLSQKIYNDFRFWPPSSPHFKAPAPKEPPYKPQSKAWKGFIT